MVGEIIATFSAPYSVLSHYVIHNSSSLAVITEPQRRPAGERIQVAGRPSGEEKYFSPLDLPTRALFFFFLHSYYFYRMIHSQPILPDRVGLVHLWFYWTFFFFFFNYPPTYDHRRQLYFVLRLIFLSATNSTRGIITQFHLCTPLNWMATLLCALLGCEKLIREN